MPDSLDIKKINNLFKKLTVQERLNWINENYDNPVFLTQLQRQDQLLTQAIFSQNLAFSIITLQTGNLFPEARSLRNITQQRYDLNITQVSHDPIAMRSNGRQVDALETNQDQTDTPSLKGEFEKSDAWISARIYDQSHANDDPIFAEWDEIHQMIRFNPIADKTPEQVEDAIFAYEIPANLEYEPNDKADIKALYQDAINTDDKSPAWTNSRTQDIENSISLTH